MNPASDTRRTKSKGLITIVQEREENGTEVKKEILK